MVSFRRRATEPEILDLRTPDAGTLEECYRFLRGVNRWLGGRRALLGRFETFARRWRPGERIRVLDVGAGAADLPAELQAWGRDRGFDVRCVALDLDRAVLGIARRLAPGVLLCQGDVARLPFREGAFDYVISSLFFHHLSDAQVRTALAAFDRIARRGIVVSDLLRRRRAWLWITLFTLPFNEILRHDGALSVRKAFTLDEIARVARDAGLSYLDVRSHFAHRFTLAGEKPHTPVPR